jgi:prepilin-type N-terminal cleavage/methylation domain-containing protein
MNPRYKQAAGFTMIELLVVIVVVAILSAIAAPSWLGFLTRQRLNAAQAEAIGALREAQTNAKREKRVWQACFRDDGTKVTWAVRPRPIIAGQDGCNNISPGLWQSITQSDADTLAIEGSLSNSNMQQPSGYYRVEFQDKGLLNKNQPTGTITFRSRREQNGSKRCVVVETILGAVRAGNDSECKRLP